MIPRALLLAALPIFFGLTLPKCVGGQELSASLLQGEAVLPGALLIRPTPLGSQGDGPLPPPILVLNQEIPPFRHAPTIAAGALGGILGFGLPILAGSVNPSAVTEGAFPYLLLAASVTGSVGIPLGVWLADGRRESVVPSGLGSLAVGAVGLSLGFGADLWPFVIATPIGQVAAAVAIEKRTRRGRE